MNIYLLKLDVGGYNCYNGFVIAAHSKDEAKEIAKEKTFDGGWSDNESDCFESESGIAVFDFIGVADESIKTPKILLEDFTPY